ncbi:MAG: hypothetical protein Q9214_005555, partial [Letrouitia sp. 1 TL-2023]
PVLNIQTYIRWLLQVNSAHSNSYTFTGFKQAGYSITGFEASESLELAKSNSTGTHRIRFFIKADSCTALISGAPHHARHY